MATVVQDQATTGAGEKATAPLLSPSLAPYPGQPLVDERSGTITCPRCEERRPIKDYAVLGMNPRYAYALSPIFRCRQCCHLFAPRLPAQILG